MRRLASPRLWAGLVLGLLIFYTLAGFVLLPFLITTYGVPAASEHLRHSIILREAAFNPFTLALRLEGLEVQGADRRPIIGFEKLVVNLRATTLFGQTLGFNEIRLVMPFVAAKVNREGKLNMLALVPPPDAAPAAESAKPAARDTKKMMPVEIELLEIEKGIVEYRDESKARPVSLDIVPIQIVLRNFSTTSTSRESDNAYAFKAEIGKGEALAWEGTISLEPFESDGKVSLSGVKISTLFQAVHDRFRFDVKQGEMKLSASYHIDMRGQAPRVTVQDGRLAVRDLEIGERVFPEPLVKIPVFDIEGVQFDLEQQAVQIETIRSSDGHAEVWMNPGGVLNMQQLFAPMAASGSPPAEPAETAAKKDSQEDSSDRPWTVSVGAFELQNFEAIFEDRTLARPQYVDVENLNVKVEEIRVPFEQAMPVDVSMTLNQSGLVAVRGRAAVDPMSADLDVKLKDISIWPFQAYLDQFLNMDVRDGTIDLAGTLRYDKAHSKKPLIRFQGDVGVNRLSVSDRKDFEEVLSWKSLAVNRLALAMEPTAVKIAEIVWQEPAVHAVIESDGSLNLSKLLVSAPADATPPQPSEGEVRKTTAQSPPPTVTVGQVKLVKTAATFHDLSIQPPVKAGISDFSGTIRGLSSKQIKKADVDLAGRVGKAAPFKVVGKINPLGEDAFTDLVVTLGAMDLTPGSPYSSKYAGYGLSKGKLSLNMKYKVSEKLLEAENLVSIDQLTFGQQVESPDATSLPVPLLVALLQDRNGLIEIDLPIRGDLNDPDFRYGKAVMSALLNLLGKIAVSPFTLLGHLVPDMEGGEDLQFIGFQPGSAALMRDETTKLDVLEKALVERAGLRLDIKGTADAVLDRAALRSRKLTDRLMAMKRQEFRITKHQETLSPEDEQRLVAELFAKLQSQQAEATGKTPEPAEDHIPTAEEMRRRVAESIPVTESDLQLLARQRGEAVQERLLASGKLANDRVFLLDVSTAESGHDPVRTQLGLAAGS